MPEVDAVKVEVQVADAVVPARVHVVKEPVTPVSLRATVPVGVRNVPAAEVSVTVTVHVDPWLITTGVVQETAVVVVRGLTTILVVPVLPPWVESPGYVAVTLAVPDVVGVNVEVHVAVAVVPLRVHVENADPVTPVWVTATVPVGVVVGAVVSVTETVQVEAWLATTGVVQLIVVVVTWTPTLTGNAVLALTA